MFFAFMLFRGINKHGWRLSTGLCW